MGKKTKDIQNIITKEKILKYIDITKRAIEIVKKAPKNNKRLDELKDFLEMIDCYYNDSIYFYHNKDYINAFAAINYAHGWIDAGARIKLYNVHDNKLFTID
jgi:hypothetical protein